MQVRNTFIIFVVSGLWHGANWTYVTWGALHAVFFLPLLLLKKNKNNSGVVASNSLFPPFKDILSILLTFTLLTLSWPFFRAETLMQAIEITAEIFSPSLLVMPQIDHYKKLYLLIFFLLAMEWRGRKHEFALEKFGRSWNPKLRYLAFYIIIILIFLFSGNSQEFIYFQF